MGMEIGMEVAQEMPGKTFLTQNMMGQEVMKMVINGEKAVVTTPQGENTVEGKEALKMSNPGIFPEMYYLDTENFTVKLDGVEMIDGKPAYKLTVNDPMREAEITNWFSAETGLMIKNDNVQATSTITEYETIDGIKFPKVMKVFQKAQNMEMIMTFDDTKLNPTFEADKFKVD
jgi:hypothetical protein